MYKDYATNMYTNVHFNKNVVIYINTSACKYNRMFSCVHCVYMHPIRKSDSTVNKMSYWLAKMWFHKKRENKCMRWNGGHNIGTATVHIIPCLILTNFSELMSFVESTDYKSFRSSPQTNRLPWSNNDIHQVNWKHWHRFTCCFSNGSCWSIVWGTIAFKFA